MRETRDHSELRNPTTATIIIERGRIKEGYELDVIPYTCVSVRA